MPRFLTDAETGEPVIIPDDAAHVMRTAGNRTNSTNIHLNSGPGGLRTIAVRESISEVDKILGPPQINPNPER